MTPILVLFFKIQPLVLAANSFQTLRCDPQRIGNCETDPFRADVESQHAWRKFRPSGLVGIHLGIIGLGLRAIGANQPRRNLGCQFASFGKAKIYT